MAGETLCTAEAGWGGILDATVRAYEMLLELRLVLCNGAAELKKLVDVSSWKDMARDIKGCLYNI